MLHDLEAYHALHRYNLIFHKKTIDSNQAFERFRKNYFLPQGVEGISTTAQLAQKASGDVYRDKNGNIIAGFSGNDIADGVFSSNIVGGGGSNGQENIIGGDTSTVGTSTPNKTKSGTTTYLTRILGGYDQVVNGITNQSSADHSFIEEGASHSSIMGGANHEILTGSDYSAINGGIGNSLKGDQTVISGGNTNEATGSNITIAGGTSNKASANSATIGGGASNITSSINATVAGGGYNTASGQSSSILGGLTNQAIGVYSSVGGGTENKATGNYSSVLGGQGNEAVGPHSNAFGAFSKARLPNEIAQGAGKFVETGDAQRSDLLYKLQTTTATQASVAVITPAQNCTWGVKGTVTGRRVDSDLESAMWEFKALIHKGESGIGELIGAPTITEIGQSTSANLVFEFVYQYGSLSLKVTGESGKTINWLAHIEIIQLLG